MAQRDDWINERMKKVLKNPFCPKCYLFLDQHDDNVCDMRYEEEPEECASSAPKLPSLELLQSLDGDSGTTV